MLLGYNEATSMKRSTLEEDLKYVKKYGYDCIELRMDKMDVFLETHTLDELIKLIGSTGVQPYAINSLEHVNLNTPEEFEVIKKEFMRMCQRADQLNCRMIVVVPSIIDNTVPKEEVLEDSVKCLNDFADIAEKYNVKVAYEYMGFSKCSVNTFSQCYEIIRKVDRENVGMVLDCFHFHASGSNIEDLLNANAEKIFTLHVDDAADLPLCDLDDSKRLWPGDGVIKLNEILGALKRIRYDKVATVELFNPDYWEWDTEKIVRTGYIKTKKVVEGYYI